MWGKVRWDEIMLSKVMLLEVRWDEVRMSKEVLYFTWRREA